MVDPNRKINRLSDDDAAFLVECEQEFRHRYTEDDEEFAAFMAKPTKQPPIVEPWQANRRHHHGGGGGGDSGNNWSRNNYRSNNRNNYNRSNDNRSQRPYHNRPNYHHNRPYERNSRREGDNHHGHGSRYPY